MSFSNWILQIICATSSPAKVALAGIRGEQTLVELPQQSDAHADQFNQWKDQLLKGATDVFGNDASTEPAIYRRPNTSKPAPSHKV